MKVSREVIKYVKVDSAPYYISWILTVRTTSEPSWFDILLGRKREVVDTEYIGNKLFTNVSTGRSAPFDLELWLEDQLVHYLNRKKYAEWKAQEDPSWKIGNRKLLENLPDLGWKNESL